MVIKKNYIVYPNPFENEIHIKTDQDAKVNLYNLEGKSLYSFSVKKGENQIILNELFSCEAKMHLGIYILEIKSRNSIERIKLLKTN